MHLLVSQQFLTSASYNDYHHLQGAQPDSGLKLGIPQLSTVADKCWFAVDSAKKHAQWMQLWKGQTLSSSQRPTRYVQPGTFSPHHLFTCSQTLCSFLLAADFVLQHFQPWRDKDAERAQSELSDPYSICAGAVV